MIQNKSCSKEGCNSPAWSKGLCKNHRIYEYHKKSRTPLKRSTKKKESKIEGDVEFYKGIWGSRVHKSEVSGIVLGRFNLMYFHHILPKSKYPDLRYDPDNIIVLHPDEHSIVEGDMYRYEEVNRRRELLKSKHNII